MENFTQQLYTDFTTFMREEREAFVEAGADLEHSRWARWQKYMHSKILPSAYDGIMEIGTELIDRWERQIKTPYSELSEKEKESDRKEVRQYLPLLEAHDQRLIEKVVEMVESKKDRISCEEIDCRSCECSRARNAVINQILSSLQAKSK